MQRAKPNTWHVVITQGHYHHATAITTTTTTGNHYYNYMWKYFQLGKALYKQSNLQNFINSLPSISSLLIIWQQDITANI